MAEPSTAAASTHSLRAAHAGTLRVARIEVSSQGRLAVWAIALCYRASSHGTHPLDALVLGSRASPALEHRASVLDFSVFYFQRAVQTQRAQGARRTRQQVHAHVRQAEIRGQT